MPSHSASRNGEHELPGPVSAQNHGQSGIGRPDRGGGRTHHGATAKQQCRSSSAAARHLLRLDVGGVNHLSPLLGLRGDELAEIGWRADKHRAIQAGYPSLELWIGEGSIDLLV